MIQCYFWTTWPNERVNNLEKLFTASPRLMVWLTPRLLRPPEQVDTGKGLRTLVFDNLPDLNNFKIAYPLSI